MIILWNTIYHLLNTITLFIKQKMTDICMQTYGIDYNVAVLWSEDTDKGEMKNQSIIIKNT